MWVFHPAAGFFSVVHQASAVEKLVVRTRVRSDLDDLRSRFLPGLSETRATPERDYPFRAWCPPADWAVAVARMAQSITYGNFKAEVARAQGRDREQIYAKVWEVMLEAQYLHVVPEQTVKPALVPTRRVSRTRKNGPKPR